MNDPVTATVRQAVALTGYKKSRIYKMIADGEVDYDESTEGRIVRMAQLRRVIDRQVRGRPFGSSKYG